MKKGCWEEIERRQETKKSDQLERQAPNLYAEWKTKHEHIPTHKEMLYTPQMSGTEL